MANVIFNKVVAKDGKTPAQRYAEISPKEEVFYLVGDELYFKEELLSANIAAEIGVADVAEYFSGATVEAVLAELYAAQIDKTIWFHDDSAGQSEYAKVYHLYQGENDYVPNREDGKQNPALIGTINTPKDLVVKSGKVVPITWDETEQALFDDTDDVTDLIVPSGQTPSADYAGKYIKLEIQNQVVPIYIAVKDLVDVYTGGTTAEATVAIDNHNVVTVTINKIAATKIIYREAGYRQLTVADTFDSAETYYTYDGTDYTVDATVDATNFDTKVASGLYVAVTEQNVKAKVDEVEAALNAEIARVGQIPATSEATTVIGYVDEKTGEGVGSLNSDADIAAKSGNVITIKGGIAEKAGIISNKMATPVTSSSADGYYNDEDGKFYAEATFDTEIPGAADTLYNDLATHKKYVYQTNKFVEVADDIVLAAVASTGAAADVSYDNTTSGMTADDVQEAIDELKENLTWVEV